MKLLIVLQSDTPERIWNTLRLGIVSLKQGHEVSIFLLNEGAAFDTVTDTNQFDISNKRSQFLQMGGVVSACQTCLHLHNNPDPQACEVSSIAMLPGLIESHDRVVVF